MTNRVPPPDPASHYGRLCSAVGLLFLQWSKLETEMAASLRLHLVRQARNKSQAGGLGAAIYGSMRMKASRDTMKRIAQELEYGDKALNWHEGFFSHIGHLETFRDKLAHQLALKANEVEDGWWMVTDLVTSRSYLNTKIYTFETESIELAAQDLVWASHIIGEFLKKGARGSAPQSPPWQYTPSMLKLQVDKMPPSRRALRRQRVSSRARAELSRKKNSK